MKKIVLLAFCALFSNSLFSQQWDGSTNSTDHIYRIGNVSIGTVFEKEKVNISGNLRLINSPSTIGFGSFTGGKGGSIFEAPVFEIYNYSNPFYVFDPSFNRPPFGLYINPGFNRANVLDGSVPDENIALYISDTKKVGIGISKVNCSTCTDYRLFVKDGIKTEKVKVEIAASNGWADYVFEKDYKLMPLNDLQKFINEKGHLPEVPTTAEAIENGIELKEMNILLLKKIEELTLYTLEQQKSLDEQKKRIELLENKLNK